MNTDQIDLFHTHHPLTQGPLAYRSRPLTMEDFLGGAQLLKNAPFLLAPTLPGLVLFGPPGVGKTTLARLLATTHKTKFYDFSAVMGNLAELRDLMKAALSDLKLTQKRSIIFIDEIHRFNKAQQDALLPGVEAGHFTLIGATTEVPQVSLNRALLSRLQLVELEKVPTVLITERLATIATRERPSVSYPPELFSLLAHWGGGDVRRAINFLELIITEYPQGIAPADMENAEFKSLIQQRCLKNSRDYDRGGDRHYDVISAFIKSMRGSDPQAAILYLAMMLEGGEDPVFIARRLMIFASEDVGNSDPWALLLATATLTAVEKIGLPEARIPLAQATTYLASTVKSNASYNAINAALDFVRAHPTLEVPAHLRNHSPQSHQYLYPHDSPDHFVLQNYRPSEAEKICFYQASEQGREKFLKERLTQLWTH